VGKKETSRRRCRGVGRGGQFPRRKAVLRLLMRLLLHRGWRIRSFLPGVRAGGFCFRRWRWSGAVVVLDGSWRRVIRSCAPVRPSDEVESDRCGQQHECSHNPGFGLCEAHSSNTSSSQLIVPQIARVRQAAMEQDSGQAASDTQPSEEIGLIGSSSWGTARRKNIAETLCTRPATDRSATSE
jgi:hypothetical protein